MSHRSGHPFTEGEILHQLDLAYQHVPSDYFPKGGPKDIQYNFFLDLEHGYCAMAGNRIHLYADSTRWAIVFEKSGYENRGTNADIDLHYFGNCIAYPIDTYPERKYITNTSSVQLIDQAEFNRIENKAGTAYETFEFISPDTKTILVRDTPVPFNPDYLDYEKLGILIRDTDNPRHLIKFEDFLRYLHETNPASLQAMDSEIRQHIPRDLPKFLTLDTFHYESAYGPQPPSSQETYQLLAKILVTRDTSLWKPTLAPNNHWSKWESGNL